jgi:hypothetical protein
MKKKIIIVLLVGLVLTAATVFWIQKDKVSAPSPPSGNAQDLPLQTGDVTVTGEVICLPHKDTSGPQTLECAIGIKDDRGVNYALLSDDPSQAGSLTGKKVRITGKLQQADPNSSYATAGTLQIQSITEL